MLALGAWVFLVAPLWAIPLNFYAIVLVSTLVLRGETLSAERRYLVWNDDVHDPDDELNSI